MDILQSMNGMLKKKTKLILLEEQLKNINKMH